MLLMALLLAVQLVRHFLIETTMLTVVVMMTKPDILMGKNALRVNHYILPPPTPIIARPNAKKTIKFHRKLILTATMM